jgi:hypothetical protein
MHPGHVNAIVSAECAYVYSATERNPRAFALTGDNAIEDARCDGPAALQAKAENKF